MSNKPRNDRFNVEYEHLARELKSVGIAVPQKEQPVRPSLDHSMAEILVKYMKDKAVRSSLENEK